MRRNPGTFTVRIRARTFSPNLVGHWSAPQRFVCDPDAGALSHVWLSSSLMALATLLSVGIAVFLCKRYSVLKTLFSPIPHLKDPIGDSLHEKMVRPGVRPRAPLGRRWPQSSPGTGKRG
ncbi:PREDICTED: interleukin-3 receptor subunit alpha-like isoform X1 [Myotis davidii]|uniref:interleukin-3 receptor subunit alpha-like isoform X1 n=1 Tax=Myotis davidii TaxID=225400 RepID=UPI00076795EE|nr:PREDICTED: interleukin-3 receptor subunit alpha-like isoform X1 [Myotis davidii]